MSTLYVIKKTRKSTLKLQVTYGSWIIDKYQNANGLLWFVVGVGLHQITGVQSRVNTIIAHFLSWYEANWWHYCTLHLSPFSDECSWGWPRQRSQDIQAEMRPVPHNRESQAAVICLYFCDAVLTVVVLYFRVANTRLVLISMDCLAVRRDRHQGLVTLQPTRIKVTI